METLNDEQLHVFQQISKGHNAFITGGAGVGKSFLVKYIVNNINKNIGVTAMTGTAALLINGSTLHSYLGIGLAKDPPELLAKRVNGFPAIKKKIIALDVLLIDEVSMLSDELFEKVLLFINIIRKGNTLQYIFVGDPFQLSPVVGKYCFLSPMWEKMKFITHKLSMNMRQAGDEPFKNLLDRIRWGECSDEDFKTLQSLKDTQFRDGIVPTKLYSKNINVDQINASEMSKLPGERFTYKLQFSNDQSKNWAKSNKVPDELVLCKGAQVMCTRNLPEMGIMNGTRAIITDLTNEYVIIESTNGQVARLTPLTLKCIDNPYLEIKYIPLKLAWCLTIHSSQGSTLSALEVDLGSDIFSYNQSYTALSRAQNFSTIRITKVLKSSFMTDPKVIEFMKSI